MATGKIVRKTHIARNARKISMADVLAYFSVKHVYVTTLTNNAILVLKYEVVHDVSGVVQRFVSFGSRLIKVTVIVRIVVAITLVVVVVVVGVKLLIMVSP